MIKIASVRHAWSTASAGGSVTTSPMELASLQRHLVSCNSHRGRFFAMACAGDAVSQFMMPRLVSLATLFFGISLLATWAL